MKTLNRLLYGTVIRNCNECSWRDWVGNVELDLSCINL